MWKVKEMVARSLSLSLFSIICYPKKLAIILSLVESHEREALGLAPRG